MLGTLRKGAHSFIAKLLMGLLVLSFAAWGIGDILRNNSSVAGIATVGDEEIPLQDFYAEIEKLKRSFGANYSPELVKSLNLYSVKLSEMINRSLIRQEVKRLGISVSDDELIKSISEDPDFRNANGDFDKPLFLRTLQHMGISESKYLDLIRTELAVRVLLSTFSQQSLVQPELLKALYASQHEKRKVELITVNTLPEALQAPDDDALEKFYEAHKASYVAPEYRSFNYVTIHPEDILSHIDISRQELFEYYTQHASEYALPEQRDVQQLLYGEKEGAEKAYSALREKMPLEEVVKTVPPKGDAVTELGFKAQAELPVGAKAVFALDKGEFTAPVQSTFGWHIFVVNDIKPESTAPFDTVKDKLKEEMTTQRANTMLSELLEQFEDALAGGKTLKEATEETGLKFHTTDPVDRFGKRSDNSETLDRTANDDILRTAFSLVQGERSELVDQPDGSYFMVEMASVTPPRERTFDEVRGQVAADLKALSDHEGLESYAKAMAAAIGAEKTDAERDKTIAGIKSVTRHTLLVDRNGAADKTQPEAVRELASPELLANVFQLETPGKVTDAAASGKQYVIAVLKEIVPAPSPDTDEEGKRQFKALKRSLREDYQNELLDQYLRYLHSRYTVVINEAAMQALMSQE